MCALLLCLGRPNLETFDFKDPQAAEIIMLVTSSCMFTCPCNMKGILEMQVQQSNCAHVALPEIFRFMLATTWSKHVAATGSIGDAWLLGNAVAKIPASTPPSNGCWTLRHALAMASFFFFFFAFLSAHSTVVKLYISPLICSSRHWIELELELAPHVARLKSI